MTTLVRPITIADADGYNRALDIVAREERFLRMVAAPPVEGSRDFVAGNIAVGNPHFVALDGAEVVGWCDIYRSSDRGSEHVGSLGMGLIPSHRGRGLGRALIEATIGAARTGFRRVELEVYASNTAAIGLYERVGFTHEGRRIGAIWLDGRDRDILMMGMVF